jgi:hypothetical protein
MNKINIFKRIFNFRFKKHETNYNRFFYDYNKVLNKRLNYKINLFKIFLYI